MIKLIDPKETSVSYFYGDEYLDVYTSELKFINRIKKLSKTNPDVKIKFENEDGSIMATMPISWFVFPRPKRKMSEEQKANASKRMKEYHANKNGVD